MSFVNDKLYNGYLRRNMATIVTRVKPIEVMMHLPCLTAHDRENIEAKTETRGKFDGMMLLLDCLKRREHWPEQFIDALEACEHTTIAAEVRAEYNALKGIHNSNPSSPPTTVVRAHVHPAPSASHLSVPESGGNSQNAVATPAEAPPARPEPAAQAPPPVEAPAQLRAPQSAADQAPKGVSPPEPVPEPPQSTQTEVPPPPSTPPPSPEAPRTEATVAPPPQSEVNSHQEPEENSESDIQDVSGDAGVIPDQTSSGNDEEMTTPQTHRPVEHCETDPPSDPELLQTAVTTEDRPPPSPSPTEMDSDMTDGSSFPTMTAAKPPVQDTTPPLDKIPAAVLQPEETSEPPATQILESSPQTETAAPTSPEPDAAGMDVSLNDDNTDCLSKPGQLVSTQPQNHTGPFVPAPSSPAEPYSGNSDRLEISEAAPDAVTSAHVPACSAVSSAVVNAVTAPPCQENGIVPNHNEPEESHYESPLETQEVLVNVVQVSEEPSILNMDGQTSAPRAQIVNGEVAKETTAAPPSSTIAADDPVSDLDTPESYKPSEPAPADMSPERETLQISEEKTVPQTPRSRSANTKYILTAVGVGACALLMAWKFKN